MSSDPEIILNSPTKTGPTGGNVQYSSLNTEASTRPRLSQKQRSEDTLKAYVDKVLNDHKVFSTLHKIRTKIMRYYAPIASVILAIIFIKANTETIEKECDEYTKKWILYGLLYFVAFSISEVTSFIVDKSGSKFFDELQKDEKWKMLFSILGTAELISNFVINIALFYAFIDRDKCGDLSSYLLAWGAVYFPLAVAAVVTLALTLFTMVTYMHYEKKRLD